MKHSINNLRELITYIENESRLTKTKVTKRKVLPTILKAIVTCVFFL